MDRLDRLRAFVRIVESGSFTAAARELHIEQSTASKWLAATEEELGVQLIDRTTRSQRATSAGQRFYEQAREILSAYDNAVAELREGESVVRGRIRLSVPVVFGRIYLVPMIADFLHKHPALEIDLVFADRYVSLVDEGFDLAVRVGVPVDSSLVTHSLGESRRRLVASPRYLRKHGTPTAPRDLRDHECLVHTNLSAPTTWRFSRGGRTHRVAVRGRVSANNSEATLALARSGLGICLLASWLVDTHIRAGRLVQLLPEYDAPAAPVRALTPPGRNLAPRVRALIDFVRERLTEICSASVTLEK